MSGVCRLAIGLTLLNGFPDRSALAQEVTRPSGIANCSLEITCFVEWDTNDALGTRTPLVIIHGWNPALIPGAPSLSLFEPFLLNDRTADTKIVAYAGNYAPSDDCLWVSFAVAKYCYGATVLGGAMDLVSDGVVPVVSAEFVDGEGRPRPVTRRFDNYTHEEIVSGKGDGFLFKFLRTDLLNAPGGTSPTVSLNRAALTFGAVSDGRAFVANTAAQTVRLSQSAPGTVTWSASASQPWLTVSPANGMGSATLTVGVRFSSGLVSTQAGTVTLSFSGAVNTAGPINVTLTVLSSTAAVQTPFGVIDTPLANTTGLAGSIAVTGWALDNIGVQRVELWRDLQPGETTPPFASTASDSRNGKVFISNATLVEGARPDVEALNPTTPFASRAGWGYLLLSRGLWNQGNGTYRLYAFAVDQENNLTTIGTTTFGVSNNTATKPFGSIDTPGIGGNAAGPNFGWALTPLVNGAPTCKIQPSGVQVSIDSGPLQPVVYGGARSDIAGAFPGFSNTTAAGGHFIFDWSSLRNGAHTIGWLVTDDCNRAEGIGSRFFNVTAGTSLTAVSDTEDGAPTTTGFTSQRAVETESDAPITLARGYGELPTIVSPGAAGSRIVEVRQGERIEIRVPRGFESAYQLVTDGRRRALPVGSTWDAASGTFYWEPAPGFLGRFRLVFGNGAERISIRILVGP